VGERIIARVLSTPESTVRSTLTAHPVRSPRQMLWSPSSTRSSRDRSGRSPAWVGRWTTTRCSSAMSPTRIRMTPRGRCSRAETSAMDRMSWQSSDGPLLHGQLRRLLHHGGGGDQRLDLQGIVSGPGTPAGHRIRPNSSRVRCWLIGGAGHGGALRGRPVTPARPAYCWLPARVGRRRSLTASGGMLSAHGGRAAWSSARSAGVRTSPVRLTSKVIS
jgi:hypothetical protein